MPTTSANITTTPRDIVRDLNLNNGATYAIAYMGGRGYPRLSVQASAPSIGDAHIKLDTERYLEITVGDDPIWMWTPLYTARISVTQLHAVIGPPRNIVDVDVSTNDYVHSGGFILQVGAAGDVNYRTLDGDTDRTETFSAAGVVAVAGVPVMLRAVRNSGTTATGLLAGTF